VTLCNVLDNYKYSEEYAASVVMVEEYECSRFFRNVDNDIRDRILENNHLYLPAVRTSKMYLKMHSYIIDDLINIKGSTSNAISWPSNGGVNGLAGDMITLLLIDSLNLLTPVHMQCDC
jgi:hypothetical protein